MYSSPILSWWTLQWTLSTIRQMSSSGLEKPVPTSLSTLRVVRVQPSSVESSQLSTRWTLTAQEWSRTHTSTIPATETQSRISIVTLFKTSSATRTILIWFFRSRSLYLKSEIPTLVSTSTWELTHSPITMVICIISWSKCQLRTEWSRKISSLELMILNLSTSTSRMTLTSTNCLLRAFKREASQTKISRASINALRIVILNSYNERWYNSTLLKSFKTTN